MNITILETNTYFEYANAAWSILPTKMAKSNIGKNIAILELANLSSPQGMLLKKGITGGRFGYVAIIIATKGIMNKKESTRDILTN